MSQLNQISPFLPLFLQALVLLISYGLGAGTAAWESDSRWILGVGTLAFLLAEVGSWLANDYYTYRSHRDVASPPKTISAEIRPEQLVLKGAWGAYLLAFLPVVIVAMTMRERGWVLYGFALAGLVTGYYRNARPLFWDRWLWATWISELASTWIPFLTSAYIVGAWPHAWASAIVAALYVILSFRKRLSPA
ncbi:MAG TPA: hypothetical protein VI895_00965 [Bdellovibrionota bacterium]|nr:hypothetical protein [Bdellovibrionota bacterium]